MVVILMSVVSAVLSRHSWHCNPVVYPFGARGEMMAYHLSGLTFIVEMSFIYYALITHARASPSTWRVKDLATQLKVANINAEPDKHHNLNISSIAIYLTKGPVVQTVDLL